MNELFSLENRVILITGSSRGIGKTLAEGCAKAGAHVIINARTAGPVAETVAALRNDGHQATAAVCDVTNADEVTAMVASIEREIGPIAGLINNAGTQIRGPFLDFDLDEFRKVLDTNLVAPFVVSQAVAKAMAERRSGRIVNIGSVQSQLGRPTIVPYTASKGGVALLTRGMCAELGPMGIQVNCIAPGYFATELTAALVDDVEFSAWVSSRTPAGRWGSVDELEGVAVFLLSDAASFVNGQTIYVDGGMTSVV